MVVALEGNQVSPYTNPSFLGWDFVEDKIRVAGVRFSPFTLEENLGSPYSNLSYKAEGKKEKKMKIRKATLVEKTKI